MNSTKKKTLLILALIFIGLFGIYKFGQMFSPGSYSGAEIYKLNYSEEKVIEAVKEFKSQHPEMSVPRVTINQSGSYDLSESEGRDNDTYWYTIYFYYPTDNQIVLTWTRPSENGTTSFAFVSLNKGLDIGHWKDVNKDFGFKEAKILKMNFEEKIVKPIELILANKKY